MDGWTNKTYGIQTLYDNVTDVFWCQFMRKFKADGRIETLKVGQEIRFIAGFAVFNSTTSSNRLAVGMTNQLNYTISDTARYYQGTSNSFILWVIGAILVVTCT